MVLTDSHCHELILTRKKRASNGILIINNSLYFWFFLLEISRNKQKRHFKDQPCHGFWAGHTCSVPKRQFGSGWLWTSQVLSRPLPCCTKMWLWEKQASGLMLTPWGQDAAAAPHYTWPEAWGWGPQQGGWWARYWCFAEPDTRQVLGRLHSPHNTALVWEKQSEEQVESRCQTILGQGPQEIHPDGLWYHQQSWLSCPVHPRRHRISGLGVKILYCPGIGALSASCDVSYANSCAQERIMPMCT